MLFPFATRHSDVDVVQTQTPGKSRPQELGVEIGFFCNQRNPVLHDEFSAGCLQMNVAQRVAHFSPKTIFYPPQRADATQLFQ
jgi:hypothetical protein